MLLWQVRTFPGQHRIQGAKDLLDSEITRQPVFALKSWGRGVRPRKYGQRPYPTRPSHHPLTSQSSNVQPTKASSSRVCPSKKSSSSQDCIHPSWQGIGTGEADGLDVYKTKWLGNSVFLLNPQLPLSQSKLFKAWNVPYQSSDGMLWKRHGVKQNEKVRLLQTAKYLPFWQTLFFLLYYEVFWVDGVITFSYIPCTF